MGPYLFRNQGDNIRQRLFREKSPTLEKVLEIIETAEASKTQVADVKQLSARNQEVHEIKKKKFKTKVYQCTRCGTKHEARKCPAFGKKCLECQGMNHFAQCCRTRKGSRKDGPQKSNPRYKPQRRFSQKSKNVHATEVTSETDSSQEDDYELDFVIDSVFCESDEEIYYDAQDKCDYQYFMFDVNDFMLHTLFDCNCEAAQAGYHRTCPVHCKVNHKNKKCVNEISEEWYQKVKVHEVEQVVNFKLDSGAQISAIPNELYEKLGKPCVDKMKKSKVKISTYNREKLNVVGKIMLTLEHKNRLYPVEF